MGKDLEKLNSIPKGTTDYYGREAKLRDYVLGKIQKNYKKFGFESLYTPIIENAEVFHGFHGEGEKLLFNLKDRDNENYVLKYDSTVPLARVVSMHDDISLPYKRYQLQQSYRDDEIDKGHFREFIQCDGDVVGCNSLATDAEFVMLSYDGLKELGFENFTIRLNHRAIIKAIAEKSGLMNKEDTLEIQRAIDYADKVIKNGTEGIRSDLEKRNINGKVINIIIDFFAMCILIGFIWIVKDLIKFFTTKLIITNKRVNGKTGLINTNELDSPLNKINGVQVRQGLFGKIFNYGTVSITTASTVFNFDYIDKPNDFKTILNNQIEKYDDDRIEKQAKKMAEAMK